MSRGPAPAPAPSAASRKPNSPTWPSDSPATSPVRSECPASTAATETVDSCPTITTADSSPMAGRSRNATSGSTSMPIDTKNTAANRSRIGRTASSTSCDAPDSATRTPPRNAPSAGE
jgi:hypothetical protein